MNLNDKIEKIIREYPQWSRVERSRMHELIEEIMNHVRDGGGNAFVQKWCDQNLGPRMEKVTSSSKSLRAKYKSGGDPRPTRASRFEIFRRIARVLAERKNDPSIITKLEEIISRNDLRAAEEFITKTGGYRR